MSSLTLDNLFSFLLDYTFIVIFCLVGAVIKDTYNTFTEKETEVKIARILISTVVSSIILFSISDILITRMSWKLIILPCFIGGMIGFNLMEKIQTVKFWVGLLSNHKDEIAEILKNVDEEEEKKNS